jgi:hypothetical protein
MVSFDGLLEDEEEIEAKAPPPVILGETPAPDGQLPDWTALWGVGANVETTAPPGNEPVEPIGPLRGIEEAEIGVEASPAEEPDVETVAPPGGEADDDAGLFSGPGWLVGEVQAPDVPVPQGCWPITGSVLGLTAALPQDWPEAPVASTASAAPPVVTASAPPTTSPQFPDDNEEGGDGQWDTSLNLGQAGEWA